MNRYEVIEIVEQVVQRERRWIVLAISDLDAIRQISDRESAETYAGEKLRLIDSKASIWFVNGNETDYSPADAIPEDDEAHDLGGGD